MPTALEELYTALTAARQNGDLTLTAANAGAPEIGGFIAGLTGQSLTLRQASLRLSDQQQPATLVVSGAVNDTWPLPGMSQTSVGAQAVTITYAQDGPGAPVTAGLAATAALAVGQHSVGLHGSLGPDGNLDLAWDTSQVGTLSLADAASVASDGQAGALIPQDLPPFSTLGLSSFTLSFGYAGGAATLMRFTLDAEPEATWDIIQGQHALQKIGVTLAVSYQPLLIGYSSSIGADVHATLDLGREFEVSVGLAPGSSIWTIDIAATDGLPALETLAQLAGAGDDVAAGLRAIGLGDITLQSVSIGVNSDAGSLAFISIQGTLSLLEKIINVSVQLPDFQFGGSLSEQTPISLTALLGSMLHSADGMPDVEITELAIAASPQAGYYSLSVTVADGEITAGKYGLSQVNLDLDKDSGGVTGGLSGTIVLGTAELILSARYLGPPTGWSFAGELTDLDIGQLITELNSTYGIDRIPEPIGTLELTKLAVSYQTGSGNFAFDLEAGFTVAATPVKVTVTITVLPSDRAPSGGDPHVAVTRGTQGYSATFTGQVTFADLQFDIVFDAADTGVDVLIADYVHTRADPVELQALVADVSADLAAAIPPGISIDLEEVKFVFLKQTTSQWAFGLRLGTQINLSELPVIGSRLPTDLTLALRNLQVLYSSAAMTTTQTGIINPLLPSGVVKLPDGIEAAGIAFDADVQLGTVSEHLHAEVALPGASPAPQAALPAAQGQLPAVTGPSSAPVPPSSTDPITWLDVNKQFGVFSFKRVGTGYQDNVLLFALDASVALGPVAFSVQALTVGSSLAKFEPAFSLKGLALTFDQPPVAIGGAFLKVPETVNGKKIDSYYGEVIVKAGTFSLRALGGWAPDADPASFFLYVSIDYPLGGPPFLFVTGLAGGFGINSRLTLPTIDGVAKYPLLPGSAPPEQATPAETIDAVLPALQDAFHPQAGAYWIAAGISLTSFEMIEARVVVSVAFGVDLQIGVIGTCAMTFPTGAPDPVGYVEIDVVASFTPSTGLLAVDGKLSPATYLFADYVKLTGGFAFYTWFAGDNAGDFVVSIGGYHPAFSKPTHYPAVPRIALAFSCGPVKVIGQAYFALTPGMFMAGMRMTATFEAGPIKAWFDAGVDFLIGWAPFHYQADAWLTIGCSVDLGLYTLSVQVGADLRVWGPEFGGEAKVDLDVVSFTISFGADPAPPGPVGWKTLTEKFLPADTTPRPAALLAHGLAATAQFTEVAQLTEAAEAPVSNTVTATVTDGLRPQAPPGADWILDPDHFRILTASAIPANHALWSTSATDTAELPNAVPSYQPAPASPAVAAARAVAAPPPAQMLLQLDHDALPYSDSLVWAPVLNIAPMDKTGIASYHTVTLRKRDERTGALTDYVTGVTVAPQLGASNTALWGVKEPDAGPNADRLIKQTLTGFAISPVPRHPDQVSDVPLLALIFGEGSPTGFGYQPPAADQRFTVTSSVSPDGETFTIGVAGEHTATLENHGYVLSALTDPWVAGQRGATLDELRRLGFTTTASEAVHLDTMAETTLTDWPGAARIGLETWA